MTFAVSTPVLGLASALALGLLALGAWRRRSLVLWPIAVLSLWSLAVRPQLPLPATGGAETLTLRTPGAPLAAGKAPGEAALERGGAALVARRHPEVATVDVRGHGLRSWEWAGAGFRLASFEPPPLRAGVSFAHWRRTLPLGAALEVRGALAATPDGTELRLLGPAGVEDRAALVAGTFTLRASPRARGPLLYTLEAGAPERPLWRETIDVVVVPARPPAVLWLEAAPSAESAFFRRWLERQGGVGALRSRPSRDRVRITTSGLETPMALRDLTAETLARFDVAVIDDDTDAAAGADAASAAELERLRAAVAAGRLGILWRGREGTRWGDAFEVRAIADLESLSVRVRAPASAAPAEPLSIAAREIVASAVEQPILFDATGRWLAARRLVGAGWVGISLLEGTFRWSLGGHDEDYASTWSALLESVAPVRADAGWRLPSGPLLVDEPASFAFDGEPTEFAIEEPSGERIPLAARRDEIEPRRARLTYWPRQRGWHRAIAGEATTWFYAQERAAWQTWQAARRQEDTRAFAARSQSRSGAPPTRRWVRRPLPRGLLFALLVASLGGLWSIERFGLGRVRLKGAAAPAAIRG